MYKVKDVLCEIEKLRKEAEILDNIVGKMIREETVAEYMKVTFETNFSDLATIRSRLSEQADKLEKKLNECEVEV